MSEPRPYRVEAYPLRHVTGWAGGEKVHAVDAWTLAGPGLAPGDLVRVGQEGRVKLEAEAARRNAVAGVGDVT